MVETLETLTCSFLKLIQAGLFETQLDSFPSLSQEEWEVCGKWAVRQRMTGVFAHGLDFLPADISVPITLAANLIVHQEHNDVCYDKIQIARRSLASFFHPVKLSFKVCKGPVVADFYPTPQMRESGDLDIYFPPQQFKAALDRLAVIGISAHPSPDGSVQYVWKDVLVDQHPYYFDLHCRSAALPPLHSDYAMLVMLSAHILKHAISGGVGLRQICDLAMAYKNTVWNRNTLLDYYKACGILHWNRTLSSFLYHYLAYDDTLFTEHSLKKAGRLMRIVEDGDFGCHASGRETALHASPARRKWHTFRRFLRNAPAALSWSPREYFAYSQILIKGNLHRKTTLPFMKKGRSEKIHLLCGKTVMKSTYETYLPIASYMNWNPSKSTDFVALKYGISPHTLSSYIRSAFPDVWQRHLRALAKKK